MQIPVDALQLPRLIFQGADLTLAVEPSGAANPVVSNAISAVPIPAAVVVTRRKRLIEGAVVLVLNAGTYGNVIRFLPPLAISDTLLHDALGVLEQALASL